MSHRYLSRTLAVQTLFEVDFTHADDRSVSDVLAYHMQEFAPDFRDGGFAHELVTGVLNNREKIDAYITHYATEWPLEQITPIDRAILRLGIFEMIFHDQIPARVAINEAIEIAKSYGGAASSKFVNGVLGALYKDILPTIKDKEDRLKKVQEEKKKSKESQSVIHNTDAQEMKDDEGA